MSTETKITLHWLEQSRSHRILWLFEELNVPYELKLWKRGSDMLADPKLKEIHPLGKSPVIEIQSPATTKPIVIAESGAIVEYIIDHFGSSMTPTRWQEGKENQIGGETESWLRNRQLMHYAEGSLMPYMVLTLVVKSIRNAPVPFFIKPITNGIASKLYSGFVEPNLKTHFAYLEGLLETIPDGGEWFCGKQLTGSDILLSYPLMASEGRTTLKQEDYPRISAFVKQFQEREAYKRAVAKIEALTKSPFKAAI